ncbi:hypothetical protein BCR32DRAFT_282088 [Anaeromyces robustus]|uniref:Uncharacterized protein n=1 Tax=Anaeromyces robustus TaxID=1754192 RepID=A0A1Y1WYG7_9FUNG|nr:hypothetical protein BCR32DRAFT_282088 [Anaeromyces robustus]|eukprot:ORX78629.1 hypothetical protein BCR32DRAFT_282088 [Anaeromyces robustus]
MSSPFHLCRYVPATRNMKKYINHKIYLFLLGGTSVLENLHFDKGEWKNLIEHLYKSSKELPCQSYAAFWSCYLFGINPTPIITKSVDVESIKHNNNISNRDVISTTGPLESSSFTRNDEVSPRERLVDTTLSLIQMLLLSSPAGLEPALPKGNGLAGHRVNHSAKVTNVDLS